VKKSNDNATHDGRIIQCPIDAVDEHAVYQRVVNNSRDGQFVEDIRVPVFGETIPFCYRVLRPVGRRFGFGVDNTSADVCEVSDLLSANEVGMLLQLCHELGLDYGELDVLRDVDDRKAYIVDVNNTPFGPPKFWTVEALLWRLKTLRDICGLVWVHFLRGAQTEGILIHAAQGCLLVGGGRILEQISESR